jgi:hypothetical protein
MISFDAGGDKSQLRVTDRRSFAALLMTSPILLMANC